MCFPRPVSKWLALCLAGAMLPGLAGCGKRPRPLGTAEGTVTIRGAPVTTGSVVFENASLGVSQIAPLDAGGAYEMKTFEGRGVPPGTYRVAVRPGGVFTGAPPLAEDPSKAAAPVFNVPAKYQSPATSGLEVTVAEGENPAFDFNLKE